MLYHYCSTAAFVSILQSGSIFLSSLASSNDTREGKYLGEVLERLMKRKHVDPFLSSDLLSTLSNLQSYTHCYGFCLSDRRDMLSQWRGYADDAAGFAIGFNEGRLREAIAALDTGSEFNHHLVPVIYDEAKQRSKLGPALKSLLDMIGDSKLAPPTILGTDYTKFATYEDAQSAYDELSRRVTAELANWGPLAFQLKNPAFSEEREMRLVRHKFFSHRGVKFRSRGNEIVPYVELKFPEAFWPSLIGDIVVGPRNPTPLNVVRDFVRDCKSEAKIALSSATYR